MSTTSNRNIQIEFSGDVSYNLIQSALENTVSPAEVIIQSLSSGANTIMAPVVSGLVVTSLTVIPPAGNTTLITLKGVTGDTGVKLHPTDPTVIALDSTFVSLVLTAAGAIVGVRLIWS
jgi:hypothetical protein